MLYPNLASIIVLNTIINLKLYQQSMGILDLFHNYFITKNTEKLHGIKNTNTSKLHLRAIYTLNGQPGGLLSRRPFVSHGTLVITV